jgi:hypothetical protein
MNIKPGDLFVWAYEISQNIIDHDDNLYSRPMQKWIPGGGVCLCTGIDKTTLIIHWISHSGIFYACSQSHITPGFIRVRPKLIK